MSSKGSPFLRWFRAQYGPQPGGKATLMELREKWVAARDREFHAERVFRNRAEYELQRDAALKAWTAAKGGGQ